MKSGRSEPQEKAAQLSWLTDAQAVAWCGIEPMMRRSTFSAEMANTLIETEPGHRRRSAVRWSLEATNNNQIQQNRGRSTEMLADLGEGTSTSFSTPPSLREGIAIDISQIECHGSAQHPPRWKHTTRRCCCVSYSCSMDRPPWPANPRAPTDSLMLIQSPE
jgi:hypothetical protein